MININEEKVSNFFNSQFCDPKQTAPLEELCSILNLSIKEDGDVIFQILKDNVQFSSETQEDSLIFPWRVNKAGCLLLKQYATAKQECLATFQKLYTSGYIKSKAAQ